MDSFKINDEVKVLEDCHDLMAFFPATAKKGSTGTVKRVIDEKVVEIHVKNFKLFENSPETYTWKFALPVSILEKIPLKN